MIDLQHEFGFSTFNNFDPVVAGFDPELIDAGITVVPIPEAAWLVMSALGVLGGIARRRTAA